MRSHHKLQLTETRFISLVYKSDNSNWLMIDRNGITEWGHPDPEPVVTLIMIDDRQMQPTNDRVSVFRIEPPETRSNDDKCE